MRKLGRRRRRQLVALYLLLSLVPLMALSFLAVVISTDAVRHRADQSLRLSASLSAHYVSDQIYTLEAIVNSFAHEPSLSAALGR